MDDFAPREGLIGEYATWAMSFFTFRDPRIRSPVERKLSDESVLWPEPLVQLNPAFEPGDPLDELGADGTPHPECRRIFTVRNEAGIEERPLRLSRHVDDYDRPASPRDPKARQLDHFAQDRLASASRRGRG